MKKSSAKPKTKTTVAPPKEVSPPDNARLVRELQARQVELEMQNEALRKRQQHLEQEVAASRRGGQAKTPQLDDSELKRGQKTLAFSEERYRTIFDSVHEGLVLLDREGNLITSNAEASDLLGYSRAQMSEMRVSSPEWTAWDEKGDPIPLERYPFHLAMQTVNPGNLSTDGAGGFRVRM